jgi:putative hydrolase of HD superfamily
MQDERFEKQMQFALEIDKEKNIFRQTHLSGGGRQENDAEHAWHMAFLIYLLKEYSNAPIDVAKTMVMALLHDVVEIDAGDTYAYDEQALASQAEREQAAAKRIFGLLPTDQAELCLSLFNEFEDNQTPEARFAHAIDNLQPVLLNNSNNGADWRAHEVTKSQIEKRQQKTKLGSTKIWEYVLSIIDENVKKGNLKNE